MKKFFLIPFAFIAFVSCKPELAATEPVVNTTDQEPVVETEKIPQGDFIFERTYYPNKQVKLEGNTYNGKREGRWVSFFENGNPWSEVYFENGMRNGSTTVWYPSGIKYYEGFYTNDQPSGHWIFYSEEGKVEKEINY
jgi:antitoxin component YwqK of YwqJK toxin-antitoxin module